MAKKENSSVIVPTAEVRLGDYVAKFTEKDLRELDDMREHIKDGFKDNILEIQDYIISTYDEFTENNAGKIIQLLNSLHGYLDFFKGLGEIDVKYVKSNHEKEE